MEDGRDHSNLCFASKDAQPAFHLSCIIVFNPVILPIEFVIFFDTGQWGVQIQHCLLEVIEESDGSWISLGNHHHGARLRSKGEVLRNGGCE